MPRAATELQTMPLYAAITVSMISAGSLSRSQQASEDERKKDGHVPIHAISQHVRSCRRCAAVTRATATVPQRSGPTGLDVFDDNGKAFRPTSLGGWQIISTYLKEKGVRAPGGLQMGLDGTSSVRTFFDRWMPPAQVSFISPQEVAFAAEQGLPIVDIRPVSEYNKGCGHGAYSAFWACACMTAAALLLCLAKLVRLLIGRQAH